MKFENITVEQGPENTPAVPAQARLGQVNTLQGPSTACKIQLGCTPTVLETVYGVKGTVVLPQSTGEVLQKQLENGNLLQDLGSLHSDATPDGKKQSPAKYFRIYLVVTPDGELIVQVPTKEKINRPWGAEVKVKPNPQFPGEFALVHLVMAVGAALGVQTAVTLPDDNMPKDD